MGVVLGNRHFAIVGCGTAGLATAIFLARSGHTVTLFERFAEAASIGAGILIQPTGMRVLEELGLLASLSQSSSRIEALDGRTPADQRVMNIRYADIGDNTHALGVHRGNLFSLLHASAIDTGVDIRCGREVVDISVVPNGKQFVMLSDGSRESGFDAIVIANGTQSALRGKLNIPQRCKPYPWGALWAIRPHVPTHPGNKLRQLFSRADVMIGLLPTGIAPGEAHSCVSFFWSLPAANFAAWRERDFAAWKAEVSAHWPDTEPVLADTAPEDFAFASYADVVMKQWHDGCRVVIGDAAHGMSPQLGQGTNLALLDAKILAACVNAHDNIADAFSAYTKLRMQHLRFYQFASRWLTPLFQSHSRVAPFLRDMAFPLMQRIPWSYREALRTIAGSKTGILFDTPIE